MLRSFFAMIAIALIAFGGLFQPTLASASNNIPVEFACKPIPKTDPFGVWPPSHLEEASEWKTARICNGLVTGQSFKYLVSYLNGAGCSNILCPARVADVSDPKNIKVIMVDMVCQDLTSFSVTRDGQELISCGLSSPLDGQLAP